MLRVLYISIYTKTPESLLSDGVMKKIHLHIDCLEKLGDEVDYVFNDEQSIYIRSDGKDIRLGVKNSKGFKYFNKILCLCRKFIKANKKKYDFIYIRHVAFNLSGYNALKYLNKISNRIYLEFPTFAIPKKTLKNRIKYYFNKKLHKYIHKAVLDSLDEEAYKMPTLRITNGTDLTKIEPRKPTYSDTINVLMVAYLQEYHGVDKIIDACKNYYDKGGNRNVVFHIVGEGPIYKQLVKLCDDEGMNRYVHFYGKLSGQSLFDVYDKCEVGISSLANKEVGVTCSSTLKSKEYLAKGLPIISDTMLDVFVNKPKYYFHILKDEFNIPELIEFYDSVYKNRNKEQIIKEIRKFAEETCDMYKVFSQLQDDYLSFVEKGGAKL